MLDSIANAITALNAFVFARIPFFGSEIPWIVLWLAVPMLVLTVYFRFINFTGFWLGFRILASKNDDPDAPGNISQFSALTTALSGTVGLGNIAGVAIAIATGGPGAAFWMFVIGIFAMTLKCAEVTLGMIYREIRPDNSVRGGPMYSLRNGLRSRGWPRTGIFLGALYACFTFIGAIPLVQVNQSMVAAVEVSGYAMTPNNQLIFGIALAFLVGMVVIGGVRWLGQVTAILVPVMSIIYVTGLFAIMAINITELPAAAALIVSDAFTGKAVVGGMVGTFIIGMQRAIYSCEAGVGSAVTAHTQAKTREPASEGIVALLEPFIDTVVMCTLAALAIVMAGTWNGEHDDIRIMTDAFAQISNWFPWLLLLAVVLFAHATLCAWGFYGLQAFEYLFGEGRYRSLAFKIFYILILPVGALLDIKVVIDLVDSAFFLMAIPNVIAIYVFAPELRRVLNDYLRAHRTQEKRP